ncbi:NADPH-dependent FMN reductase [Ectopseudomonas oleovorans]|uniref:NADPH-dependent FMN reductase n=1 Tax=Ectopseudomonas oleovorans TaxID=301 RepID=UPI000CF14CC4|nr:NAD(P)H-dependent oxidoreductase [Pseudomonas oleovorans]PPV40930.1 NAD(P)H-dependent oxidoreductase [Pseudomonas oleovorans]
MKTTYLLGLCGSLRRASSNAVVMHTLATELLPAGVQLHLHPLHELPLYNGDADTDDAPPAVRMLREAVEQAEGLILGSPEYSHGMSGVMKNALDWLSPPHRQPLLKGKAILGFTASPTFTGGSRAQQQLNETLWAVEANQVHYPQIVITDIDSKIRDGRLKDAASRQFLAQGVVALEELIRSKQPLSATLIWA